MVVWFGCLFLSDKVGGGFDKVVECFLEFGFDKEVVYFLSNVCEFEDVLVLDRFVDASDDVDDSHGRLVGWSLSLAM
jgi:hypothetical protein